MSVRSGAKGSLTVCGLGIERPRDVTLGAIQAFKDSDVVFYMHGDGEVLRPFLREFCADVRLCGAGRESMPIDEKMRLVARDICAELKKARRVAYATYGHPLIFSDAFHVMNYCRSRGFRCRVLPGLSAVDSVIAALHDVEGLLEMGVVSCNGADILGKPELLSGGLPVVLFCVDALVSSGLYGRFCDVLEKRYPLGHPLFAIKCRDTHGEEIRLDGRVGDARGWETKVSHMMSFVVPV